MLSPGTFRAVAIGAVLGMTETGKEQIAVQFETLEPEGERITWYGYFTDGTFERTIESLRHCGWRGNDLIEFAAGRPLPEGFGAEVEIVVDEEEFNGRTRLKVRWVNGSGGIAVKNTLDESQARAFSARMKSRVAALQAKNGTRAPAATSAPSMRGAQATHPADDDIPF